MVTRRPADGAKTASRASSVRFLGGGWVFANSTRSLYHLPVVGTHRKTVRTLSFVLSLALVSAPAVGAPPAPSDVTALVTRVTRGTPEGDILAQLARMDRKVVLEPLSALLVSRDERVRRVAALALGAARAHEAANAVGRLLEDPAPDVVIAAADALLRLNGKEAVEPVARLLSHGSSRVRCGAAGRLAHLAARGGMRAIGAALDGARVPEEVACFALALLVGKDRSGLAASVKLLAEQDTRPLGEAVVRKAGRAGLSAMAKALASRQDPGLLAGTIAVARRMGVDGTEWIGELLGQRHPKVREAALRALLHDVARAEVQKLLLDAAAKAPPSVRADVIDALAHAKQKAIAPLCRRWMRDGPMPVRVAAARALGELLDKSAAGDLLPLYRAERARATKQNAPLREAILWAMGRFRNVDWIPVFVDAFGTDGEEQAGVDGVVAIGEPAVRTLLLVIKIGDMRRIPFAVEALARIGAGVADVVKDLFQHPNEAIRILARDLMAASGDPKAVAPLVSLFKSGSLEDPVPVLEAIATFDVPASRAALIEAVRHTASGVREAAVKGLADGHMRYGDVVSALVRAAETDTDAGVRATAVQSLFRLGAPGLAALLGRIVGYDGPEVRTVAYEALGWIGDPAAVAPMASRLGDAKGKELTELTTALQRLTQKPSLRAARDYLEWHKAWNAANAQPAGARDGVVKRGERELHYRLLGTGVETLLCISGQHGGDVFGAVTGALARGRRVVTYDPRGRGRSTYGSGKLTLKTELEDIAALLVAVKANRVSILAHDTGALLGLAFAAAQPDNVRRLVLVSPPETARLDGVGMLAAQRLAPTAATDLARLDARRAWFHPAAWLRYRQAALAPGLVVQAAMAPRVTAHPIYPTAEQALVTALHGQRLTGLLSRTKQPVLIVVGERPVLTRDDLSAIAKAQTQHRTSTQRVPGTAHYPHLERPAELARLVAAFLD